MQLFSKIHPALVLYVPIALFLFALNPFLEPDTYDNVVYVEGAQSLSSQGSYRSGDAYITDWPPLLSTILAIPMLFGYTSIWASKIVIVISVVFAISLAYRLLILEDRPLPLLSCVLTLVTPGSFLWGTRIASEWPYLGLSCLFLLLLAKLQAMRSRHFLILSGITLGACLLLRYIGVTLFAAVIAQGFLEYKKNHRTPWPELGVLAIGSLLFSLFWVVPMVLIRMYGLASSKYYGDTSFVQWPQPTEEIWALQDLFIFSSAINKFPIIWPIATSALIIVLLALCGMGLIFFKRLARPTDWYVLAVLAVLSVHHSHWTRYLIPIAPWTFSYLFYTLSYYAKQLPLIWHNRLFHAFWVGIAVWISFLVAMDVFLLRFGNQRTYNGLSYLVSSSPEQFYAGEWRDLYLLCRAIKEDPKPGNIGVLEIGATRYVQFFTGRHVVSFPSSEPMRFLITTDRELASLDSPPHSAFHKLQSYGHYVLLISENKELGLPLENPIHKKYQAVDATAYSFRNVGGIR